MTEITNPGNSDGLPRRSRSVIPALGFNRIERFCPTVLSWGQARSSSSGSFGTDGLLGFNGALVWDGSILEYGPHISYGSLVTERCSPCMRLAQLLLGSLILNGSLALFGALCFSGSLAPMVLSNGSARSRQWFSRVFGPHACSVLLPALARSRGVGSLV